VVLPPVVVEVAEPVKTPLQINSAISELRPERFTPNVTAPAEMGLGIWVPAGAAISATVFAVCLGLHLRDLRIHAATRALSFNVSTVVIVEMERKTGPFYAEGLRRQR
jgi:hypothetical protein